jgi:Holliday junction resolvasome RuvABC endonuclease subunit
MIRIAIQEYRVLAIDVISRGFGFAVLEGPQKLIDWGLKQIKKEKKERTAKVAAELIEHYAPDMVIVEDWVGKGSRRCMRIGELIRNIMVLATRHKIPSRCFSRDRVRQAFSEERAWTKHQIAAAVSKQLPELRIRLPRYRKPWMTEDERMAIFNAAAFALTFFRLSFGQGYFPTKAS